jgi:S1-C subfamily serine protease
MTCWPRVCVGALGILLSACARKSISPSLAKPLRTADAFISTIETMKHSVAPVICMNGDGPQAAVQHVEGTAFFISRTGDFLTAAHVIDEMQAHHHPCPVTAIYLPSARWRADTPDETVRWFPFHTSECVIQSAQDLARCSPVDDLSVPRPGFSFEVRPVQLEFSDQADGTQVAFTGFPLGVRDPFTSRGGIATHRSSKDSAQLVLDQTAWPGASGSPVYLSDGRVIGIMLARGIDEGAGIAVVRPARLIRPILETQIPRAVSRREQHTHKPSESAGE